MDITKPFTIWVVYSVLVVLLKLFYFTSMWWLAVSVLIVLPPLTATAYLVTRFFDGLPK